MRIRLSQNVLWGIVGFLFAFLFLELFVLCLSYEKRGVPFELSKSVLTIRYAVPKDIVFVPAVDIDVICSNTNVSLWMCNSSINTDKVVNSTSIFFKTQQKFRFCLNVSDCLKNQGNQTCVKVC